MERFLRARRVVVAVFCFVGISGRATAGSLTSGEAPRAPNQSYTWSSSRLDFLGTARSDTSHVWFTGFNGIVGQVFYPRVDTPATVDWQFMIGDAGHTWVDEEKVATTSAVSLIDPRAMSWTLVNTANNGKYRIEKRIFTDPNRDSLVVRVTFTALVGHLGDFNLYTLYHPALDDAGTATTASSMTVNGTLLFAAQHVVSAGTLDQGDASVLLTSLPFKAGMMSSGFVGLSDGWQDLKGSQPPDFTMNWTYDSATNGNVAQMGQFDLSAHAGDTAIQFDLVLGFGNSITTAARAAKATLADNLDNMLTTYNNGWHIYTAGLNNQKGAADQQYYVAAMALKTAQNKDPGTGAMVAGVGTPWGADTDASDGYHVVFPRDLYKSASALMVAGDPQTANASLDFLLNKMQQADGHFPRYFFFSGADQESPQLDQTAFPIILAWKLGRNDAATYNNHIKPAANYLLMNGPTTGVERWEEASGYSPSTIAAEIAGLVCAADIAKTNHDQASADRFLLAADYWQALVESWTFTTHGMNNNTLCYERIDGDGNPENGKPLNIASCGGSPDERTVVDAGFLELVRHGVKSPTDPYVVASLPVVDGTIKRTIPNKGDGFLRYNSDAYGENANGTGWPIACTLCRTDPTKKGIGRPWPLLTGERGHFVIAGGGNAAAQLAALRSFANASFLIPEQEFDTATLPPGAQAGTPTNSMCPLSWAMGEYITLFASNAQGKMLDRPDVVYQRYVAGAFTPDPQKTVDYKPSDLSQGHALTIFYKGSLAGSARLTAHWGYNNWQGTTDRPMILRQDGFWQATVPIPVTAATLNFAFTDGTNWDNNGTANWNLTVAPTVFRATVTPFDAWPSSPVPQGQTVTIYYKGPLAAAAQSVTMHWGQAGSPNWSDLHMTKQPDGYWTATLTAPPYPISFALFDQNTTWDNNGAKNYSVGAIPR
jgi:glucoamylase